MLSQTFKRVLFICLLITGTLLLAGCAPTQTPYPLATASISPTSTPVAAAAPTATVVEVTSTSAVPPVYSGPFKRVAILDEVLDGAAGALVSAADGAMWLVSNEQVARINGDDISVYLEAYQGQFAGIDAIGRVWVVSEDTAQISAWDGQAWAAYGEGDGWIASSENYYEVSGGQTDPHGRVWFATSQDLRSFDGSRLTIYARDQMGMDPPIYDDLMQAFAVAVLKNGEVWVGECDWGGPGPFGGGGVRWLDGGDWQGGTSLVASGCVNAIAEDAIGRVWVGVDSSLWRYDPATGDWLEFPAPDPPVAEMRFGFFDSLAVDAADAAWAELVLCGGASCFGKSVLYHLSGEEWVQVGPVGDYDSGYWGPIFDVNGSPWVYWEGGIYRVSGDVPELVSPLVSPFAARGSDGRVWLVAPYEKRDALWVLESEP